jgi:hypothetical protein
VAVYALGKIAVQEGILDVKLVHRPLSVRRKMKYRSDCGRFDHQGEGLMKVGAGPLTSNHPSSFVPFEGAVRI